MSKVYARATLTGNKGTVLHVEFSNENDARGNTKGGVAADNKGNVFKVRCLQLIAVRSIKPI